MLQVWTALPGVTALRAPGSTPAAGPLPNQSSPAGSSLPCLHHPPQQHPKQLSTQLGGQLRERGLQRSRRREHAVLWAVHTPSRLHSLPRQGLHHGAPAAEHVHSNSTLRLVSAHIFPLCWELCSAVVHMYVPSASPGLPTTLLAMALDHRQQRRACHGMHPVST
jgi:hypothetical protein